MLNDRSLRKEIRLQRSLLRFGLACKQALDADQKKVSKAMAIKYALVSENFAQQLEELGPDPLQGFEVASSGSSVDEARLVRMGWEVVFDHKEPCVTREDFASTDAVNAVVKNGVLIVKVKTGNHLYLSNIPNRKNYKGIKWRFKFVGNAGGQVALKDKIGSHKGSTARITIRDGEAGLSQGYGKEFGAKNLIDDWNDLTFLWDGKAVSVTLNGEAYDKPVPFLSDTVASITFSTGGGSGDKELHIQSVMGLLK